MTLILITVHILVCLFLIFVVLLQSAQAADLAGAFGGGGSQTALGMRGATTLLQKATTVAAVVFMLTSLTLGMIDRTSSSLIEGLDVPAVTAPEGDPAQSAPDSEQQPAAGAEQQAGQAPAGEGGEQSTGGSEQASGSEQRQP